MIIFFSSSFYPLPAFFHLRPRTAACSQRLKSHSSDLSMSHAALPGGFSGPDSAVRLCPSVADASERRARWSLLERPAGEHYHQSECAGEAEAAERGVGNNGSASSSGTPPPNSTVLLLLSHLTPFFSSSLRDIIEIIIPCRGQMRFDAGGGWGGWVR